MMRETTQQENTINELQRKNEMLQIKYESEKRLNKKLQEQNNYLEQQMKILIKLNKIYTETSGTALKILIENNRENNNNKKNKCMCTDTEIESNDEFESEDEVLNEKY
jgi:16S rRNA C1402 (ribose-2'-O) methylase RsmI